MFPNKKGADVVEFKKLKLAKKKILNKIVSKAGMIQAGQRCAITGITTSGLPSLLFIAPAYTPPGTSTATAYHTITHLRESTNCSSQLLKYSKD